MFAYMGDGSGGAQAPSVLLSGGHEGAQAPSVLLTGGGMRCQLSIDTHTF